jgi:hypothetical protein
MNDEGRRMNDEGRSKKEERRSFFLLLGYA